MFLMCAWRKINTEIYCTIIFSRIILLFIHTNTCTHKVMLLYAQDKVWAYISQVIHSGHLWRIWIKRSVFPISTLHTFLLTCINCSYSF